jgi:hypothetical protein
VSECGYSGSVKEHRLHHGLNRNPTAIKSTMGARTLSYIEDGQLHAIPAILDRIHAAIDSLATEAAGRSDA